VADRLVNSIPDARLVRLAGVARLVPEETLSIRRTTADFIKRERRHEPFSYQMVSKIGRL
jgi:hypothetical protein